MSGTTMSSSVAHFSSPEWPCRHTLALRYSRLERLHFKALGRWPRRVVERRLDAAYLDDFERRQARGS